MTAHEFIGGFLYEYFDSHDLEGCEQAALELIAALKAAGYAVVELPKGEADDDGQIWFGDYDFRVDRTGGQVSVWRRGSEVTPTMLRLLAGECLAAADAAETDHG